MSSHPPKLAFDLDQDVRVLSAMASSLTPYLFEDEIFGSLEHNMPRLTLGGLLLRLHRLQCLEDALDVEQLETVKNAQLNFEAERTKWAVHYERKIVRELRSRLMALERFLAECSEKGSGCASEYPVQAEKRTMIHHLVGEASRLNILAEDIELQLNHADQKLRRLLTGSAFITEDILRVAYPPEEYWWLYGYITAE